MSNVRVSRKLSYFNFLDGDSHTGWQRKNVSIKLKINKCNNSLTITYNASNSTSFKIKFNINIFALKTTKNTSFLNTHMVKMFYYRNRV